MPAEHVPGVGDAAGELTRRAALIHEARTLGALEHPNIVPVHTLGTEERADPVLVMKRVDGVTWRVLLEDPTHALWSVIAVHGDRMRAHIEILLQLCRALSFAHSKRIVRRRNGAHHAHAERSRQASCRQVLAAVAAGSAERCAIDSGTRGESSSA